MAATSVGLTLHVASAATNKILCVDKGYRIASYDDRLCPSCYPVSYSPNDTGSNYGMFRRPIDKATHPGILGSDLPRAGPQPVKILWF